MIINRYTRLLRSMAAILLFGVVTACATARPEFEMTYSLIPVDKHWEETPVPQMEAIVQKYKPTIDSLMSIVVGRSDVYMEASRPEAPLNNWTADVIKAEAEREFGQPVDFAVMNVGGIRNPIARGNVTLGDLYSAFSFDNKLTLVRLKGRDVRELFDIIALRGGEAVSRDVRFTIVQNKAFEPTIAGQPLDDEHIYAIATIDYLANGGDDMSPFGKAVERIDNLTLMRDAIIRYVQRETAAGRSLSAKWEGRIIVNSLEVE